MWKRKYHEKKKEKQKEKGEEDAWNELLLRPPRMFVLHAEKYAELSNEVSRRLQVPACDPRGSGYVCVQICCYLKVHLIDFGMATKVGESLGAAGEGLSAGGTTLQ